MGYLLFAIATILQLILAPILYFYGLVASIRKREFSNYHKQIAISIDQLGNAVAVYLFNDIMITPNSNHRFGNPDETISSVLGKNLDDGTLRITGKILCWILNYLQVDHTKKSEELDCN